MRSPLPVPDRAPRWQQGDWVNEDPTFEKASRPGDLLWNRREDERRSKVAHSPIAVRAPIEDMADIAEGGLRTQHETGYSRGYYGPEDRATYETEYAGFSDHPVYGYMDIPEHERYATHYGEAKIRMRSHVRDRTTVMEGDSLDSVNAPSSVNEVAAGRTSLPRWTDDPSPYEDSGDLGYYEAQIHHPEGQEAASYSTITEKPLSRVPVADMASVDLDWEQWEETREEALDNNGVEQWDPSWGPEYMDRASRRNLGQQFADQGADVWHTERKHAYQPPLPFGVSPRDLGFRPASKYFAGAQQGDWHQFGDSPTRPLNASQFREQYHQKDY